MIDGYKLLARIRQVMESNMSTPLRSDLISNPDINNYDTGQTETFELIIKIVSDMIAEQDEN